MLKISKQQTDWEKGFSDFRLTETTEPGKFELFVAHSKCALRDNKWSCEDRNFSKSRDLTCRLTADPAMFFCENFPFEQLTIENYQQYIQIVSHITTEVSIGARSSPESPTGFNFYEIREWQAKRFPAASRPFVLGALAESSLGDHLYQCRMSYKR